MTCHSANSAHFVRTSLLTWPRNAEAVQFTDSADRPVHHRQRSHPPHSTPHSFFRPRSHHAPSLRSTGCRLHCTWKETWRLLATALPPNSAGSAIVADQGQEVCLERRPFPLAPSPPTPLRRSSLAAAAKRPLAVSVGSARPNSQRLQLVSRTAVGLVTGEPRGGDVFTSRLS